ncbi:MAG: murein biosynthesis integral membrane protein MurJ [Minisyncoccia bacterium]
MINHTLKKIINYESTTVLGAGLLMSVLTFIGSLLGLLRNTLLASKFGVSLSLDLYYASFRLPDLIYNIFILGAISVTFIPLFNEFLVGDREKAWQFTSLMFIGVGIIFSILSGFIIVFSKPLMGLILKGFSEDGIEIASKLTRIMMLQPLLLGFSSIITGVLRSFRLFFITSLSPLAYNLGIIIGILCFVPKLGIMGLAFGVVLGAFLHLLIQIPSLIHLDYHFSIPNFKNFQNKIKTIISLIVSRSSSIIISQLFLLGITSLASFLQTGTISIISLVDSILPYTTFALPFADAAFPYLSKLESENKYDQFLEVFFKTLRQILFFIIPLAFWVIIFRESIVRLLLGYGKFNWQATLNTSKVMGIMAIGMIFQSINYFLLKIFFVKKNALLPFLASIISYSSGFIVCFYLTKKFDILGLASGITITYFIYTIILYLLTCRYINYQSFYAKDFYLIIKKILIAAIISGTIGFISFVYLSSLTNLSKVKNLIFVTFFSGFVVLIIFYIILQNLQVPEIKEIKQLILKRIKKD